MTLTDSRRAMRTTAVVLAPLAVLLLPACARVSVDPIEVKPIHIVMDVNVKIDRQLDEFFAFEDKYKAPASAPVATTQPAAAGEPQAAGSRQ